MTNNADTQKAKNRIGRQRTSFMTTELLIYAAFLFNTVYSLVYPVYTALHGTSYNIIILMFVILICLSEHVLGFRTNHLLKIIIFFTLIAAVICINSSGIGLIITIVWPLMVIYVFKNATLMMNYLSRISFLAFLGWLLALVATVTYSKQYFADFDAGIIMDGINPNTAAIIIVFMTFFLQMYLDERKKSRILKIGVYLFSFIGLYRTNSRTTLIAFAVVLLMGVVLKQKIIISKKLALTIAILMITIGIIFPIAYTVVFTKNIIPSDMRFLGKRLFTGRQYIWFNLWQYLQQHKEAWIYGTGYNTTFYSKGTFNMHNAYLAILAQYGIIVLVCYIVYLLDSIKGMYNSANRISDVQFKCYQMLIYMLIVGFAEGTFTYLPNMLYVAMSIGIGNREKIEVNET